MFQSIFFALSLVLFLIALILNVVILRAPDLKDPSLLGASRRLRIGAWTVASIPALYEVFSSYTTLDLSMSLNYTLIALVLLGCADVFMSVCRIFGFVSIEEVVPPPKNVFNPLRNATPEESYVSRSAKDNSPT